MGLDAKKNNGYKSNEFHDAKIHQIPEWGVIRSGNLENIYSHNFSF
jgi:hypothetical protein